MKYEEKYLFFKFLKIIIILMFFLAKKNYEIIGWQVEDIYQNLAVTYIFIT